MYDRTIREICNEALKTLEEADKYNKTILPEDIEGYFIEIKNIVAAMYDDMK